MSFSSFDTLNTGTLRGGTGTASPVRGLRAMRDLRSLTRKVPKPRISMWWPCARARHGVQERLDRLGHVLLGQPRPLGNLIHDIGLGHLPLLAPGRSP